MMRADGDDEEDSNSVADSGGGATPTPGTRNSTDSPAPDDSRDTNNSQQPKQRPMPKDYSKRGILAKKGMGKLYKPWTLRNVFVDLNQTLAYFDGTTLKGEILLNGVTVRELSREEADGRPYAFEISNITGVRRTQDNVLVLAASSPLEAQEWIDCLRAASCSTVRQRALGGPGYMSLSTELKGAPQTSSSDMDNIKRLREKRAQQAREKKEQEEFRQKEADERKSRDTAVSAASAEDV